MIEETKPIDRDDRLNHVLAEYLDAAGTDRFVDPAVWLDRYPEFRVELQEFFALRGRIESLTAPLRENPTHDRSAPVTLGGYELLGEIGHGGMGIVYEARQIGAGRLVALKMIRAGQFATPVERARFRAEAEAAARLDHPRIVPVHEVGEIDGHPYYTMKLMSGGDLRGHLGRLRDDPAEAARLIAALARAIHHAHQHGVLHRDLKPSNVLLDGDANPHVADFGLARRLGEEGAGLTTSGELLGTVAYMSPEQALGQSALVTTAADVYGLGAVLYACLTGRPPFDDSVPLVALDQLRSRDPLPPDRENPRVPRDLAAICLKCLEKEPHRRYASAGEMADDLGRFLAGRPTHARPIGTVRRTVRAARRRPGTAALVVTAILAVGITIGLGVRHTVLMAEADAEVRAAERELERHEFYASLERVRVRRADPVPGWTWENLDDLARLAAMAPAADHQTDLRDEAVAALTATDIRPVGSLAAGFRTYPLAFHPNGDWVALGEWAAGPNGECRVRLVDPENDRLVREMSFPTDPAWEAASDRQDGCRSQGVSPDGRWLVAGTRGGRVYRWDLDRDGPPDRMAALAGDIRVATFHPTIPVLYVGNDRELVALDTAAGWKQTGRLNPPGGVGRPLPLPDAVDLLVSIDGAVHRVHPRTLKSLQTADPRLPDYTFCVSPSGRAAATVRDYRLWLTDPDTLLAHELAVTTDTVDHAGPSEATFSPDGSLLGAAWENRGKVVMWDVAGGEVVSQFAVPVGVEYGGSLRLAFAPDGRHLLVAGDHEVRRFEVRRGSVAETLLHQAAPIEVAAVAPDGSGIASLGRRDRADAPYHGYLHALGAGGPPRVVTRHEFIQPVQGPVRAAALPNAAGFAYLSWYILGLRQPGDGCTTTTFLGAGTNDLRAGADGQMWLALNHEVRTWELPLWRQAGRWVNTPDEGQSGYVFRVVAPARGWALAGRRDGKVFRLDVGREDRGVGWAVAGHPISALGVSPDGRLAAAGTDAGELVLFDPLTGAVSARVPTAHRDAVTAVALTNEGLVVTGGRDRGVQLWGRDGVRLGRLPTGGPVRELGFTRHGTELIALVAGERALRQWDLARLAAELTRRGIDPGFAPASPPPPSAPMPAPPAAPSPHGLTAELFAGPRHERLLRTRIVPRIDLNRVVTVPEPELPLAHFSIRWTGWLRPPEPGRYGFTLRANGPARLWVNGKVVISLSAAGTKSASTNLTDRPGPMRVDYADQGLPGLCELMWTRPSPTGSRPHLIPAEYLFRSKGDAERATPGAGPVAAVPVHALGVGAVVRGVAVLPDGRGLSYEEDGTFRVWDLLTGAEVRRFAGPTPGKAGRPLRVSPDGRHAAVADECGFVRVWDLGSGAEAYSLGPFPESTMMGFSPGGRYLAAGGGGEGNIGIWEAADGRHVQTLRGSGGELAWTNEGQFVWCGKDCLCPLDIVSGYDVATATRWWVFPGWCQHRFTRIAASPATRRIALATPAFGLVSVIDLGTGGERRFDLAAEPTCLAFSPDGRHLAAGGSAGEVRVWDVELEKEVARMSVPGTTVQDVAFTADGQHILTGSSNRAVQVYRLPR